MPPTLKSLIGRQRLEESQTVIALLRLLGCVFLAVVLCHSTARANPVPVLPEWGVGRWVLVGLFNLSVSSAIAMLIFAVVFGLNADTVKRLLPVVAFVTGIGLATNYAVNGNSYVAPLPVIAIVELVLLTLSMWRLRLLPFGSALLVSCGILVIGSIIGGFVAPYVFPETDFFYGWWPRPG